MEYFLLNLLFLCRSPNTSNLNKYIEVFLDLTSAFDINNSILFSCLQTILDINTVPYLTERQQSIHNNNCKLLNTPLTNGDPRGSILSPSLFIL